MENKLTEAINALGLSNIAASCGVTYQAVRKWEQNGFPRTEWTGETSHAENIVAISEGLFVKEDFLHRRTCFKRSLPAKSNCAY